MGVQTIDVWKFPIEIIEIENIEVLNKIFYLFYK